MLEKLSWWTCSLLELQVLYMFLLIEEIPDPLLVRILDPSVMMILFLHSWWYSLSFSVHLSGETTLWLVVCTRTNQNLGSSLPLCDTILRDPTGVPWPHLAGWPCGIQLEYSIIVVVNKSHFFLCVSRVWPTGPFREIRLDSSVEAEERSNHRLQWY